MNLRRIRLRLTLAYTALTAVAVVVLAVVANRWGTERVYDSAERDAEQVVSDVLLQPYWDDEFSVRNVWLVRPDDEYFEDFGDTDVEPPLLTIAGAVGADTPTFTRFEQDGTWLAYARRINDVEVMVAAIDLPARMVVHADSRSVPAGHLMPMPVTAIRGRPL